MISQWLYPRTEASKTLKIATVTMQCDLDPEMNRARMAEWIAAVLQRHPDTDLILFGEVILGWYARREGTKAYHQSIAETIPGETTLFASTLARQHGIYLCFGMTEDHQGDIYNSLVLINPVGKIDAVHRKYNLMESASIFKAGKVPVTVVSIKDIPVGLILCSDIQNKVVRSELKKQRIALILGGLASPKDPNFFISGMIAKLFDSWIITANRYGEEDHFFFDGNMIISNPQGTIQRSSFGKEQFLFETTHFIEKETKLHTLIRRAFALISLIPFITKQIALQILSKINDNGNAKKKTG